MKREEILEASRKENKKKDIYEIELENKASKFGAIAMLFTTLIFYSYEILSGKGINSGLFALITIFNCTLFGYKGIKSKKNKKTNIFASITWGTLSLILILSYFGIL